MDLLQALVLGIVQGFTEVLPISSSAHLIIVPWLFRWDDPGLTFDVALHLGTLVAVLGYFWRDWLRLLGGLFRSLTGRRRADDTEARLFWLIALSAIPGAAAGALGEGAAESSLRNPWLIALLTVALGFLLVSAEILGGRARLLKHLGLRDAIVIGLAQALAIIPGVSRSGVTITAGLFRGLTRDAAARFSFLMSTPIIAGAAVYSMRNVLEEGLPTDQQLAFAVGILSAAIVGWATIGLLLSFVRRRSLLVFAYYRFAFGLLIIGLLVSGVR